MSTTLVLGGLWLVFGVTHSLPSSLRLRPLLVAQLGAAAFQLLYSAVALASFVPLVWIYVGNRHAGPPLWHFTATPGLRGVMAVGMGVAVCLLVAGLVRPSPASLSKGRPEVAGVYRLTRHPVFMALGLFGLLHLLVVRVHTADLVFFAGFPLYTLIGSHHQDLRKLATAGEAFRRFHAQTPFLPFSQPAGLLPALREQPLAVFAGVVLTLGLRWLHPALLGSSS